MLSGEERREEKGTFLEGGHSKDSGTRERAKEIWREKEESS